MAGKLNVVSSEVELVALITCPDSESADTLASKLVESGCAACVNIVNGLTSVYRWKGEICRDSELLLVVKTTSDRREAVAHQVSEHHPYDEPELLFLPIHSGSQSYLSWLVKEVKSGT